jgi:hypothetical protein
LTDPLFYVIMVHIMKKVKSILKKVRARNGTDIFYTYSNWPIEEIDGEKFIAVVREVPDSKKNQIVHYMKKDSMEYVK